MGGGVGTPWIAPYPYFHQQGEQARMASLPWLACLSLCSPRAFACGSHARRNSWSHTSVSEVWVILQADVSEVAQAVWC